MDKTAIIDTIYQALQAHLKKNKKSPIKDVSFDGDNKSCELIIVVEEDGGHEEFVLSSEAVTLYEPEPPDNPYPIWHPGH
jgi:hypothetical protein